MSINHCALEFKIVITADVTCPWCYISRKNLGAAIVALSEKNNLKFSISSKPFVLDPSVPPGGISWHDQLLTKYGEKIAKQEMKGNGPISKAGKNVGIKFDPDRYIVNSIKSHLLLQYTREKFPAKEVELYHLLCQQYFEESININSDKVLQNYAANLGLNHIEALGYFTSEENVKRLFADIQKTRKKGILGVPHFQIIITGFNESNPLKFSGGQDKNNFIDIFQKMIKDYQKSLKSKK